MYFWETFTSNNMKQDFQRTRTENDLIGPMEVPNDALYGIQTLRGINNFRISHFKLHDYPLFIKGLGITKKAAAIANHELGLLPDPLAGAILQACDEVIEGKHDKEFPVDMIQGGAGTSTNMNANEVIANRALEIMGYPRGAYEQCSPNDHVNLSQSTNDAYPTAIRSGLYYTHLELLKHFKELIASFRKKEEEFASIIKMGRTQMQDAVPMTLGQTFGGFASILNDEVANLEFAAKELLTVNMGATAIGTGICSVPGYAKKCVAALSKVTGFEFKLSPDLVAATSDTSSMIGYSSAMKRVAAKMNIICNDLRLLSSGPRCGFNEINLPPMQPGSSIMPGKVNPVIPEVMNQIAYKVIGNDICVTMSGEASQLELNAMEPVMAQCCFESAELLMNGFDTLRVRCIDGITANEEVCKRYVHNSIGIVTALNPFIGYKNSTKIAKEAMETGRGVYELILEHDILSKEDLDTILAPENMIQPVQLNIKPKKRG
jgi:aspartate ammonia-lyase